MFELNEEQNIIRQSVYDFAKTELSPHAAYWDRSEEFPWPSVNKMAEMGLTGLHLPTAYGGTDADLVTCGIALEEIARFDHNCAVILCGCNITGRILMHASKKIRETFLPEIVQGKSIIAFGATEPEAGSNIRAIRTRAEITDTTYVVSGEKSMITFAGVASAFIVLVRTDTKHGKGISCILIESNSPHIDIQELKGFGWKATKWGNAAFSEVEVPLENLVGELNNALPMLKSTVQRQRALTGLIALGTAAETLDEAVKYAKIREVFGKPLGKFEGIQFTLAEDYALLQSARLVCYQALSLIEKGNAKASQWAAMANLMGGETAYKIVNDAMDVYGGMGYTEDLPFERSLRDIKATQIANATLKIEIGRALFGKDFFPYA
ncbi:MAG: acyl-CoA/acyl-ACP dehydrogenase [Deltaproteobacteria bacterium]|nr:acyl-CoA/acyl-ACP dehydrogenase [Deltaproteobacteria bacterium]